MRLSLAQPEAEINFHRSIFLVTSSRGCPQLVVRVGPMEFGERHDTRTNGKHYTAVDRPPTNQISAWQAGTRGSRPTRRHPREDPRVETAFVEFKLNNAVTAAGN